MSLHQLKNLQINASDFVKKVENNLGEHMSCRAGCSACCYTDISVFTWEAAIIMEWFHKLSIAEQEGLIEKWNNSTLQKNVDGKSPCSFLKNDLCSIYEARPIICRTQGVAVEIDNQIDFCPLNFKDIAIQKEFVLNLDRLNQLSSIAQTQYEKESSDTRFTGRIKLKDLQKALCDSKKPI